MKGFIAIYHFFPLHFDSLNNGSVLAILLSEGDSWVEMNLLAVAECISPYRHGLNIARNHRSCELYLVPLQNGNSGRGLVTSHVRRDTY